MTGDPVGRRSGGLTTEHPVPQHIGDYQVLRLLGHGNNGRVHLARPPQRLGGTEEFMAVKVFNGPCPDRVYDRVVDELRVVSSLASPYLTRVFEAGLVADSLFYAMEYVQLGSLAAPRRPLRQNEVLLAVSHAASAAHALHEAGTTHGAITPQNVLIGSQHALLSDVGLGRYLHPGLTMTGLAASDAVEYLDPLVLRGDPPSRASDVWSIGATLHHALAGVGLYGELSHHEPLLAIRAVMSADPVPANHLSPATAEVVQACLAPIDHRLPTAEAVAQRLTDLASQVTS